MSRPPPQFSFLQVTNVNLLLYNLPEMFMTMEIYVQILFPPTDGSYCIYFSAICFFSLNLHLRHFSTSVCVDLHLFFYRNKSMYTTFTIHIKE